MPSARTTLVLSVALLCGCAEPEAVEEPSCSLEAQFPSLIALLQSSELKPAVDIVQKQLLDTGFLEPAVTAIVSALQAAPAPPAPVSERVVASGSSLPRSVGLYLAGRPPASVSHYEVTTALKRTVSGCDQLIVFADEILNTPVPAGCTLGAAECDLAWHALLVAVRELVATPSIRDALGSVSSESLTEAEFVELLKRFTSYFGSKSLNFAEVTELAQTSVLPRVTDPALRAALEKLLSTIEHVLAPELDIQRALSSSLPCFEANDANDSVYHMLFALLGDAAFQTSEAVASAPAVDDATVAWVGRLVRHLRVQKADFDAIVRVLSVLLDRDNASIIVPALLRSADAGLLDQPSRLLTPVSCP